MSKSTRSLSIALVALVLAASLSHNVYRFFDDRAISRETDRARNSAAAAASPATVPDDARQWLQRNGYRVVFWNPHDPSGFVGKEESSEGVFRVVMGQLPIRRGNWLGRRTWVNLTFRFTPDGAFHDVQAHSSPAELPNTRAPK